MRIGSCPTVDASTNGNQADPVDLGRSANPYTAFPFLVLRERSVSRWIVLQFGKIEPRRSFALVFIETRSIRDERYFNH